MVVDRTGQNFFFAARALGDFYVCPDGSDIETVREVCPGWATTRGGSKPEPFA